MFEWKNALHGRAEMNDRYADLAKDILKSTILAGVTVWIVWITVFALLGK